MKTIKKYSASTQSANGGAAKGTAGNPYTEEEFNSMANAGTWNGGYVEGMGYVLPEVTVKGSSNSFSFSSFESWSDPWGIGNNPWGNSEEDIPSLPTGEEGTGGGNGGNQGGSNHATGATNSSYPQIGKTISGTACLYKFAENVGVRSTFHYECGVRISGNTMSIGVNIQPCGFVDRNFWATAIVKSNGGGEAYHKLTRSSQGYIYPSGWSAVGDVSFTLPKSGNVTVDICIGYNNDTGTGNINDSDIVHIYPF